ncbi:toll/interleukin-1 receptor domain-containing protein [Candidatus Frankia alpina]|uniref:toll/interleukin-1 receptor domain-containing protein n=1 Tax=Candidatus Frankia alpina TaxID=2699483 RepID=UPI001F48B247|nr:toll/interleukin-1 receptor domain-containing protein [Candidatus Frankia alpina]
MTTPLSWQARSWETAPRIPADPPVAEPRAHRGALPAASWEEGESAGRPRRAQKAIFISYVDADLAWAQWIAWQLEEAGYPALIEAWDFAAGTHPVDRLHQTVADALPTLAVLSAAYLASTETPAQWQSAWHQGAAGHTGALLAVRVEDCPRPGLLGRLGAVDLFDLDRDTARMRLLAAVRAGRAKPAVEPPYPGPGGAAAEANAGLGAWPGERGAVADLPPSPAWVREELRHAEALLALGRPGQAAYRFTAIADRFAAAGQVGDPLWFAARFGLLRARDRQSDLRDQGQQGQATARCSHLVERARAELGERHELVHSMLAYQLSRMRNIPRLEP